MREGLDGDGLERVVRGDVLEDLGWAEGGAVLPCALVFGMGEWVYEAWVNGFGIWATGCTTPGRLDIYYEGKRETA